MAQFRCESCGEFVEECHIVSGGHVVLVVVNDYEAGHAMDQSCYEGNHANCPVPVPVQYQEQELCGPVVEFSEEQQT